MAENNDDAVFEGENQENVEKLSDSKRKAKIENGRKEFNKVFPPQEKGAPSAKHNSLQHQKNSKSKGEKQMGSLQQQQRSPENKSGSQKQNGEAKLVEKAIPPAVQAKVFDATPKKSVARESIATKLAENRDEHKFSPTSDILKKYREELEQQEKTTRAKKSDLWRELMKRLEEANDLTDGYWDRPRRPFAEDTVEV
eukprot:3525159-Rhodomonas_salina.1